MATKFKKYYEASGTFNPEEFAWETWFDYDSATVMIGYKAADLGMFEIEYRPFIEKNADGTDKLSHKGKCLELLKKEGYGEFAGQCQHCGAHLRYCCIFRNTVNGELIVVGETCAEKRMGLTLDQLEIDRQKAKNQAIETRAWRAAQISTWLEADRTREDLLKWLGEQSYDEFYSSLLRHFRENGSLTEAQEAAAWKSKARQAAWETKKAEEAALAQPAPEGRLQVTGEILSTRWVDSQFGSTKKMVVKAEGGFRFYCTVPSSISGDAQVGSKISLTVTLERSRDDETFAWGSRPSKAEIVE